MSNLSTEQLSVYGIPDIMQVNLYSKYSCFVPPELQSIVYSKPNESKIKKIKNQCRKISKKRLNMIKSLKNK